MKVDLRNTLAALSVLATITVAGCADIGATLGGGGDAGCTDSSTWFERQRQLADGHANPQDAAIDAPCRQAGHAERAGQRDDRQGDLYGSGD